MKIRLPSLTLALAALAVVLQILPGAASALQFDRTALAAGEGWRWLTAHVVHFNPSHLAWDVFMLVVLGAWVEQISRRGLALTLAFSAAVISTAVWLFQPGLATYRGLSGVDCALFGYVLGHFILRARERRDRPMELVAVTSCAFFLVKTLFEFASGETLFAETQAAFVPVPLAHLAGLLAGLAVRGCTRAGSSPITPFYGRDEAII